MNHEVQAERTARMEDTVNKLIEAVNIADHTEMVRNYGNVVTVVFDNMWEAAKFAREYENRFEITVETRGMIHLYTDVPFTLAFWYR